MLLRLAGPVVAAEVGAMSMVIVDNIMIGRVGPAALGGVAVGGNLFMAFSIFGMGMLLGLDYLVSHAYGAGRIADAHRSLVQGIYLALGLSAALMILIRLGIPQFGRLKIAPDVMAEAVPFLKAITWGLPPLLLFVALRRYLQAVGLVKPIMFALVSANLVNAALDWILIFGHLGFPALRAAGAGWATCIGRFYLFGFLAIYLLVHERRQASGLLDTSRQIDREHLQRLISLGLPAAVQILLEVGVFAVATILVGRLGAVPLSAHQIAVVMASFTFMVPLGVSSAGAVRVGQALGAGDPVRAARNGWVALALGVSFMTVAAISFALFPRLIMEAFTADRGVIETGTRLLRVAAIFQLFDGVQVVSTGILRGTGETRLPMAANLIGHWVIGLPIGYVLGLRMGGGVVGLWIGLCAGLIAVAIFQILAWARRARRLESGPGVAGLLRAKGE